MHAKFWSEDLNGIDHMEGLGVGGKIILEWILGKYGTKMWNGCIWLRIGTRSCSYEKDNEPSFKKGEIS
jgi:hypothetical protein